MSAKSRRGKRAGHWGSYDLLACPVIINRSKQITNQKEVTRMSTEAATSDPIIANQHTIIANQETIIANQETIIANQEKLNAALSNQATIVANQEVILSNQAKLDTVLA